MIKTLFFALVISGLLISSAFGQNSSGAANSSPRRANSNSYDNAANIVIGQPQASSTVRGRVYYEDSGRPVKRSTLMLVTVDRITGSGEFSAMTDGNGEFVMHNIRAGTYYAMVNAPGVISPIAFLDLSRMDQRGGDRDMLTDGVMIFEKIIIDGVNEVNLQVPAKRGGAISGRISYENGDPAIGARVEIMRKANGKYTPVFSNIFSIMSIFTGASGNGQSDDRGMYRFSGLPPGEYVVRVSESAQHTEVGERNAGGPMGFGSLLMGSSSFLTFYFPNVTEVKDAQILRVIMGQELSETNIIIPDNSLFNLSGKVISGKDKKPVAGAKVSLKKSNEDVFSLFSEIGRELNTAVTDAEGNWKFKEMPKGEYSITVEPGSKREITDSEDYAANSNIARRPKTPPAPTFAKKFQNVQIEDKDVADVIVELGSGALVSGTVSTANSRNMPTSFSIDAIGENNVSAASTTIFSYADRESDDNGRKTTADFKLENVASGRINLKFSTNDPDYYVKSAQAGMTDLLVTPLELKDGDSVINLKIVLADDAGTLKGKVLDDENHPVSGVRILLIPTDAAKRRASNLFKNTRSDLEGKFEIKLPPGEYAILLPKTGMEELSRNDFNKWLDEAMRLPDKVTIQPEGDSTVTIKNPGK